MPIRGRTRGKACRWARLAAGVACPRCSRPLGSMATDIRPVFARERRILEFYGYADLSDAIVVGAHPVWAGVETALRRLAPEPLSCSC